MVFVILVEFRGNIFISRCIIIPKMSLSIQKIYLNQGVNYTDATFACVVPKRPWDIVIILLV